MFVLFRFERNKHFMVDQPLQNSKDYTAKFSTRFWEHRLPGRVFEYFAFRIHYNLEKTGNIREGKNV